VSKKDCLRFTTFETQLMILLVLFDGSVLAIEYSCKYEELLEIILTHIIGIFRSRRMR
jgi:hypothetical protein